MSKIISIILIFFCITSSIVVVFNPVSAAESAETSWISMLPMSQARSGLGVVVVEGKIYAIGGGGVTTNEQYDPAAGTWITLKPMPTPRDYFAIAAHEGKIYCINHGLNEVYDIATDSWSIKSPPAYLPSTGAPLQANVVDGKLFLIANVGQSGMYKYDPDTNSSVLYDFFTDLRIEKTGLWLFMYDPVADSWAEKTGVTKNFDPLHSNDAYRFVSTVVDDKIIVIGSFYGGGSTYRPRMDNKVLVYDPKVDVWSEVYSAPTTDETFFYDAAAGATTGIYEPKRIYIFQEARTTVYDPIKNMWYTAESMPTARRQVGVAVVDDVFYVIGGAVHLSELIPDISPLPIYRVEESSANERYMPGYLKPLLSGVAPSATFTPSELEPSNSFITSESEIKPSLTCLIVVTLVIVIVTIVTGLIFYKKRSRKGDLM